jgi:hypothetical protein
LELIPLILSGDSEASTASASRNRLFKKNQLKFLE